MRKFSLGVIANKFSIKVCVRYVLMCPKFSIMKNTLTPNAFVCWYIPLNNYYFRNEFIYMNITCSVLEIKEFALKLLVTALHQLAHRVFSLLL